MSAYLPEQIYQALLKDPELTIKEIMAIQNTPYSTAARYRQKFKSLKHGDQVHHKINKTKIENWRQANNQPQQMKDLLKELLNSTGFESTLCLRKIYYERYSKVKNGEMQSRRNFNRYFKKAREESDFNTCILEIYRSEITKLGFATRKKTDFKPSDY